MTTLGIHKMKADGENYCHLVLENGWQFGTPFLLGQPMADLAEPTLHYLTLEEDLKDEQELLDDDDDGDPEQARIRYRAGAGDCAYVFGFSTSLVFSQHAKEKLAKVLKETGQLFPVSVESETFYFYNCTRLLHAVDPDNSEIRYVANARPSQFTKLVFLEDVVKEEWLFKTHWPAPSEPSPVDYSTIPPPLPIFATQRFVDLVNKHQLTGFRFTPVEAD